MSGELVIGKVRTSYGVKGEMKILSYSGEADHFLELGSLFLVSGESRREFLVSDVRLSGQDILLKLEGIDSPEEVRKYNGWDIVVARDRAAPLQEGEYYLADLVGCTLSFKGAPVGSVKAVAEGGGGDMLEVSRTDGSVCYVPFRKEFIGEVDTERKTIELLVDWILG